MKKANLTYSSLILFAFLMASCRLTNMVPENEKLLVKNTIEHQEGVAIDLSDESDYLLQRPNRKLFGIYRFHLRAYQAAYNGIAKGKDSTRWRKALLDLGEPPVILDTSLCRKTAQNLSDYYFSKGYLNNKVSYELDSRRFSAKKGKVKYAVSLGDYRTIDSVSYTAPSPQITSLINYYSAKALIKAGQRLDFENIQAERTRLTLLMRNHGYYYFNSSFIDFSLDTNQRARGSDIQVNIRNNRDDAPHFKQAIHDVVIYIGQGNNQDTVHLDGLKLLENSYYINPKVIAKHVFFKSGDTYNAGKVSSTYSSLLSMGLFDFVTIRFSPAEADSLHQLDAEILLQMATKHDFTWEPQAITTEQGGGIEAASERNYGIGNNFSWRIRNVFGNGEAFNISSNTSLETQFKADEIRALSNFRQSVTTDLILPSLVFAENTYVANDVASKSTRIGVSYLYERNVNYTRHVLPFNFTYSFQSNQTLYGITPFRLSYNRSIVEQDFLDNVDEESKAYIRQLLTNNIITGPLISFYWTNQNALSKRYWTVRSSPMELSGTLFSVYHLATGETGYNKEVFGVKYSQYARTDVDVSFNHRIDEDNAFAYRFYAGMGFPFGNSEFLPFERRFFVGGANSLRAWRPRTIGPGSYADENNTISIEKTGEIILQANAEYRFTVIENKLNAAVFFDAGNIWNFREDVNFEDGEFQFTDFYRELAINTGLGVRYDFSFLIFRVDWGVALHDPSLPLTDRWVIKDFLSSGWILDNTALNFAVGYPF